MTIRVALQGRIREFTVQGGARFVLALEPPSWQRPRGTGFGWFITRIYRPVSYDAATNTAICLSEAEYWA